MSIYSKTCDEGTLKQCISQPGVQGVYPISKNHTLFLPILGDIAKHGIAHPVLVKCTPLFYILSDYNIFSQ